MEQLLRSETSHQIEKDALLDHISYLEDCRTRASEYLAKALRASEDGAIGEFEVGEAISLLWEAKDVSEARRAKSSVLVSSAVEMKEDQNG